MVLILDWRMNHCCKFQIQNLVAKNFSKMFVSRLKKLFFIGKVFTATFNIEVRLVG